MIGQVFQRNDRTAGQLMTPSGAATWLPAHARIRDVERQLRTAPHSQILLADELPGPVAGVARKDKLLLALIAVPNHRLTALGRAPLSVPADLPADELLVRFQRRREHLALVGDGAEPVGVVTPEDVIEVLTGPIEDETDR